MIAAGDAGLRRLLGVAALEAGHEVSVAREGDGALDLLLGEPPDLVVVELALPGLGGFGLLQELRNCGVDRRTRVLVVGSTGTESERERCLELGAAEYLAPVEEDDLTAAMTDLLALSTEELWARRERERDRAHLLSQLESVFGEAQAGGHSQLGRWPRSSAHDPLTMD
jgi:DNA-binding response OmpR family regulator